MATASAAALAPGNLAVVTGAASGIGLAAARAFAERGMRVALVDIAGDALDAAWRRGDDLTVRERGETAVAVAVAKASTTRVGLDVATRACDLMGARATTRREAYDRYWRNLRVHTLHDPVDYKLRERLMDELKARFPGLEIESCSSGGARVDLGVLERTDRVWVSDCIDPLDRQQMNRWTMQLLPPELLGSHIASGRSHVTGRRHDLAFRAGTAVFGHLGIEWDLTEATAAELTPSSRKRASLRSSPDRYPVMSPCTECTCAPETRCSASVTSMTPSSTSWAAMTNAAAAVRLPTRVCSIQSLFFSMVNSMSQRSL